MTTLQSMLTIRRRVLCAVILAVGMMAVGLMFTHAGAANAQAPKEAPAGVTACSALITNGSFETGDFADWEALGSPEITERAYAGSYSAAVGGTDNADDSFYQGVELPASVTSAFDGLTLESIVYTAEVNGLYRAKVIAKER